MELSLVTNKKNSLMQEIAAENKKLEEINSKTIELAQLERQKELIEQTYKTYKKKAEELRISDDLDKSRISSIKIATPAIPPLTPIHPKKGFIIGSSAILGIFLSFGFSAIREFFNHTFRDDDDVVSVLGVPLLVSVPLRVSVEGAFKTNHRTIWDRLFGKRDSYHDAYPRRTVTSPRPVVTSGSNNLAFAIFVLLGIGGYFFYMYQNMLIYQSAIETQRNLAQISNLEKNITTSNLTPFVLMNNNQQQNDAKFDNESVDKKIDDKKELVLLSDELEKRRAELEKQRIAITEELERLKLEMEQKRHKGVFDKEF